MYICLICKQPMVYERKAFDPVPLCEYFRKQFEAHTQIECDNRLLIQKRNWHTLRDWLGLFRRTG